jgi:hypothetical protein
MNHARFELTNDAAVRSSSLARVLHQPLSNAIRTIDQAFERIDVRFEGVMGERLANESAYADVIAWASESTSDTNYEADALDCVWEDLALELSSL